MKIKKLNTWENLKTSFSGITPSEWIFRGQANSEWKLSNSLQRNGIIKSKLPKSPTSYSCKTQYVLSYPSALSYKLNINQIIHFIGTSLIFLSGMGMLYAKTVHIGTGQSYSNIAAACPTLSPGDTVIVHSGTYDTYQYYAGLKGSAGHWITIRKAANENVEINGGWQFTSSEYIRIENLSFKANAKYDNTLLHFDHAGDCNKLSNHLVIDSCSFLDVTGGNTFKLGGASDFVVSNCKFINNSSNAAGIALNESRNGIIRNCYFENIKTKGIQFKLGTFNIQVIANYFKDAGTDDCALKIGESGGSQYYCPDASDWQAKDIKIYSNIFVGGKTPFSVGLAINTDIANNTIVSPATFVLRLLSDETIFENKNNTFTNNLFYLDKTIYFNGSSSALNIDFPSIVFSNNLFYATHNTGWTGPDPYGGYYDAEEIKGVKFIHNIIANPLFKNLVLADFQLNSNSPALAAGLSITEPKFDFLGKPFKAVRCIGAIESDSVLTTTSLNLSTFELILFPNPSHFILHLGLKETEAFKAEIYNSQGIQILTTNNTASINIEHFPSGVYWIKAIQADKHYLGKFIKI